MKLNILAASPSVARSRSFVSLLVVRRPPRSKLLVSTFFFFKIWPRFTLSFDFEFTELSHREVRGTMSGNYLYWLRSQYKCHSKPPVQNPNYLYWLRGPTIFFYHFCWPNTTKFLLLKKTKKNYVRPFQARARLLPRRRPRKLTAGPFLDLLGGDSKPAADGSGVAPVFPAVSQPVAPPRP